MWKSTLYDHVAVMYFFGFSNDEDEIVQISSAVKSGSL